VLGAQLDPAKYLARAEHLTGPRTEFKSEAIAGVFGAFVRVLRGKGRIA
jgi:hypothetical protein